MLSLLTPLNNPARPGNPLGAAGCASLRHRTPGRSPFRVRWISRLTLLLIASCEAARAAQPAPTPASPAPEVVELSPFTVQGGDDVGYLARSSLAGTRLSQPLADTAAQVSVFTR